MGRLWRLRALALGAGLVLAAAGAAWAGETECGGFTLNAGDKTTDKVDNAPAGDSAGDMRVLTRKLNDSSGEEVAVAYIVATLAAVRAGGENVFLGDFHIVFRDGLVLGKGTYVRPNDTALATDPMTVIVIGGGGVYAGAEGTIEISAGEHPTYTFDMTCGG